MSYQLSFQPQCSEPYLGPSLTCSGLQVVVFMTILDQLIRAKQEVSRLCKRVDASKPAGDYYDFIVVGGGTAGAVAAARLSEVTNWNVLLLEAGPDEPPGSSIPSMVAAFLGSEIDWKYRTVNEPNACLMSNRSCSWPRGKNLGGTSVHNGMMYIRGHARDYDDWAALGNPGWRWEDVLPFFLRLEDNGELDRVGTRYHAKGGPLHVERFPWQPEMTANILYAAHERGYPISIDLNGDNIVGFTVAQTTSRNGVRASSASAFLQPARSRSNLQVLLNATVTKIIFENDRATGVEYIKDGLFRRVKARREVVVSGGAVGSPHLLLLSGIGPQQQLRSKNVRVVKDLPGVGENLQNHVSYTLTFTVNQPNVYDLDWAVASEYLAFQTGPMSSTGLSQITGIVPSRYATDDHPDIQFFFGGYQAGCNPTGGIGNLQDNSLRRISISPTILHPWSRGTLRLASNDPTEKPIITQNYLTDKRDRDVLVEGIYIALDLVNTTRLAKYNIALSNELIPACSRFTGITYWYCAITQDTGPENHQAGSCKMGPRSDPLAVVDAKLRVHGVKGLRVADTSIMPKVTSGNTAAPAMMIGERVADFIKADYSVKNNLCPEDNSLENFNWAVQYLDAKRHFW